MLGEYGRNATDLVQEIVQESESTKSLYFISVDCQFQEMEAFHGM
jgi:hypothetical protein